MGWGFWALSINFPLPGIIPIINLAQSSLYSVPIIIISIRSAKSSLYYEPMYSCDANIRLATVFVVISHFTSYSNVRMRLAKAMSLAHMRFGENPEPANESEKA